MYWWDYNRFLWLGFIIWRTYFYRILLSLLPSWSPGIRGTTGCEVVAGWVDRGTIGVEVRVSWEVVRTDDSIPAADWVVTETGGVEVAYWVDGERTGIEASGSWVDGMSDDCDSAAGWVVSKGDSCSIEYVAGWAAEETVGNNDVVGSQVGGTPIIDSVCG